MAAGGKKFEMWIKGKNEKGYRTKGQNCIKGGYEGDDRTAQYIPLKPLVASFYQGNYCAARKLDPEDPRCAHVILAGEMVPLKKNSQEEIFAKKVRRDESIFFFNDPDLDPTFMGVYSLEDWTWIPFLEGPGLK